MDDLLTSTISSVSASKLARALNTWRMTGNKRSASHFSRCPLGIVRGVWVRGCLVPRLHYCARPMYFGSRGYVAEMH